MQKHVADLPSGGGIAIEFDDDDGLCNAIVLTDTEQGDVYLSAADLWAIAAVVNFNKELREAIS